MSNDMQQIIFGWIPPANWFPSKRYGYVKVEEYVKGRRFFSDEAVLACLYVKGFQHFVKIPNWRNHFADIRAFRDYIIREKGFGWGPWTHITTSAFDSVTYDAHHLTFAFTRERDAVEFRLRWE